MVRSGFGLAVAILCLPLLAASNDRTARPQLPTIGATIEVSIVNVDVVVTDKNGKRVQGLGKDDFDVYEDGVRQPITNFTEYLRESLPGTTSPATATPESAGGRQRRTVVLFVERFRLPSARTEPMFRAMKKMVEGTIRPGDACTVVTWYHGEVKTLQPFTDDVALLSRAIDALARQNTAAVHDDYNEARVAANDVEDFELEAEEFAIANNAGTATVKAMQEGAEDMKSFAGRDQALRARADMERKVRTINALIRTMAGFDGRRVLVLATHRLSHVAGAEYFWANGVADDMIDSLDRMEFDTGEIVQSLSETANANGVVVYPMFPEGVEVQAVALAERGAVTDTATLSGSQRPHRGGGPGYEYLIQNNEMPVLQRVASQTGGIAASGSGDVEKVLSSVSEDFNTYYSLAYRTTPRSLDKARSIVVKTRNPELSIRSRREVIEKSDQTRMEDRVLASLFEKQGNARLPFSVKLGQRRGGEKRFRIPVSVRVPISALTMLPNGPNFSGGFSVYVAWTGKVGGVGDAIHETKLFHIPLDEVEKAKQSYFTYDFEIAADRQTDRLSLVVVDEVSREFGLRVYDFHRTAQAAANTHAR